MRGKLEKASQLMEVACTLSLERYIIICHMIGDMAEGRTFQKKETV